MTRDSRIFVAGGTTLYGRALTDHLRTEGYTDLVGTGGDEPDPVDTRTTKIRESRVTPPPWVGGRGAFP